MGLNDYPVGLVDRGRPASTWEYIPASAVEPPRWRLGELIFVNTGGLRLLLLQWLTFLEGAQRYWLPILWLEVVLDEAPKHLLCEVHPPPQLRRLYGEYSLRLPLTVLSLLVMLLGVTLALLAGQDPLWGLLALPPFARYSSKHWDLPAVSDRAE